MDAPPVRKRSTLGVAWVSVALVLCALAVWKRTELSTITTKILPAKVTELFALVKTGRSTSTARVWTTQELSQYDGSVDGQPLVLAIFGEVCSRVNL